MKHRPDTLSGFNASEREHMYLLKSTKKPSKHLSMTEACKCNCWFHLRAFKKRGQEAVQMADFQSNHHP